MRRHFQGSKTAVFFRPDPFIYNTEKTHVVEMVSGRAEDIWFGPEGFEWWMEWEISIQCPFHFEWFPFDTQVKICILVGQQRCGDQMRYIPSVTVTQ